MITGLDQADGRRWHKHRFRSEYSGSPGAGASAGPVNEDELSLQGSPKFGAIDDSRSLIAISALKCTLLRENRLDKNQRRGRDKRRN